MAQDREVLVGTLGFLLGLGVGLAILARERSRQNTRLKGLLRELKSVPEVKDSPFSTTSQLALTVAHQQRIQHELEQQVETDRQILDAAPIGYLQVDDENRLVWCNAPARSLLSIAPAVSPTPRLLLELVRSYELDQLVDQTRSLRQHCQKEWTFYPVSPDPSQLFNQPAYVLRAYGFPLRHNHVGVFLENRQEAITLLQQRDRWASDVAHELKTPLTSIRLVAETLQSRLDLPLRGWVDRLVSETIRLSSLVQDLLDLALIDRESFHCLHLKTTDLPELVQSAWINLEPLARKKQIQLEYRGPDHVLIQADESRLYRVLVNLLDNGIKYSPPWETIWVHITVVDSIDTAPSSQVYLEVSDAGPGFTESDLPHVFERFYRADPARSRPSIQEIKGLLSAGTPQPAPATPSRPPETERDDIQRRNSSGLGLAIVRQIVEAHHGSVAASNHPETGGACLQVCLPQQQPDRPESPRPIGIN